MGERVVHISSTSALLVCICKYIPAISMTSRIFNLTFTVRYRTISVLYSFDTRTVSFKTVINTKFEGFSS